MSKEFRFDDIITPNECQKKCQANEECEYLQVNSSGNFKGCWLKTAAAKDGIKPGDNYIFGPKHCGNLCSNISMLADNPKILSRLINMVITI